MTTTTQSPQCVASPWKTYFRLKLSACAWRCGCSFTVIVQTGDGMASVYNLTFKWRSRCCTVVPTDRIDVKYTSNNWPVKVEWGFPFILPACCTGTVVIIFLFKGFVLSVLGWLQGQAPGKPQGGCWVTWLQATSACLVVPYIRASCAGATGQPFWWQAPLLWFRSISILLTWKYFYFQ